MRRAARAHVVERLRARGAEIEQAIVLRVRDRWFDQTGDDDLEYVAGLHAAAVAALEYALEGIERWGERLAPVPAEAIEQARRAARMGVGLDTVLRRYFAGHAVVEDFVMREAEGGVLRGQGPVLREVLAIIAVLVDRLAAAVGRAYKRASEQAGGLTGSADSSALQASATQPARAASRARTESAVCRELVTGAQRERVLAAIVQVVAEHGCARAPVGTIAARARVSRATFYKLFPDGLDAGLAAVLDHGLEQVAGRVARAFDAEQGWRDGTRTALASVLAFLDAEPELARVCLVQTLGGSPAVLEHRAQAVRAFRRLVVTRIEAEVTGGSPLAAEGVLGSVMEILRARLSTGPQRLIGLLGPLMGLVVEYVEGPDIAVQEAQRAAQLALAIEAEAPERKPTGALLVAETPTALPASIANPTAYRLRECVLHLAEHSGASNRAIGAALGVVHKSQVSKLLSRLESDELATKRSLAAGGANEWRLTRYGEEIARALSGNRGALRREA
ncbi:MAG TPA: TetR/AcrR family transcriptional regulator [Solirubrobacteraceae bacterium]|nr:TetR/AcrR family transcriptional regulator [Solirubrobacteraceae bacterium]